MGKGRRRAKTGDKALYKARSTLLEQQSSRNDDDVDPMYNEIDRFHNARDEEFLRLDQEENQDSDSDEDQEEAVLDLGIGGESSEESETEDEEDDQVEKLEEASSSDEDEELSASSDDADELMDMGDVRDWGKKKSAYYHGDTADLEIGQDEEDAFEEEEAAKEVQAARYQEMSEDDFVLSDTEEEKKASEETMEKLTALRDVSKLSTKERGRLLDKQHPEMLPLLSYFSNTATDLEERTAVATRALFDDEEGTAEAVGSTKLGQQYLLTKSLLQTSTTLNLAMYLLLKSEQSGREDTDVSLIQSHPVMARLQKWNSMAQKLEDRVEKKVEGLSEQLDNLAKAAALMASEELNESSEESASEEEEGEVVAGKEKAEDADENFAHSDDSPSIASSGDGSDESENEYEEIVSRNVLNEARFGLRPNEITKAATSGKRQRRPVSTDYGDGGLDNVNKAASMSLATTLNSIEQRSATRKRKAAPLAEHLDEAEEDDDELHRGLEMMEAELGKGSEDEEEEAGSDNEELEVELDDDDDDFYALVSKKSKAKKKQKKNLYKVAPKYPRMEREIEGERAISRTIMNNRGLVPHKSKLNRNPRVKKREQYRKALIRRKGAVREIRADEGHKYGGEQTGIKTGLSRSRKLVS